MIVLTPQILVVPAAHLPISVERQQQIINTIKAALQRNPMQGFCLTGSPKKGKTYLLKAIRNSIRSGYRTITTVKGTEGCIVPDFVTLSNWLRARKNTEIGQAEGEESYIARWISPAKIHELARQNENNSTALFETAPLTTLHLFIDECDTQPSDTLYALDQVKSLINEIYENAPRKGDGNQQAFCQLVLTMNKTWDEFKAKYGDDIAHRVDQMCLRLNFDTPYITDCKLRPYNANAKPSEYDLVKPQPKVEHFFQPRLAPLIGNKDSGDVLDKLCL